MNIKQILFPEVLAKKPLRYDLMEKGETLKIEREAIRKDGTKVVFEMNSKMMPDGTVQSFFRDNTERRKAEEDLRESEEKYRIMINLAPDAFFQGDAIGNFIDVNKSAVELTGYSREELLKMNMNDLFTKDYLEKKSLRYDLVSDGKTIKMEREGIRKDGTKIFFEMNSKKMPDGTYQSFIRDITKRKKAEEALQNSESRLRTLIQSIPDMVWMKNPDGVYLTCNRIMERYFQAPEIDIIGKTDYDFVDKTIADGFREGDISAILAGKPTHKEEWIVYPDDGHSAFIDTIKTPLYDTNGILIGVLGIARDFSDRKRVEEALRISEEKYRRMLNAAPANVLFIGLNGIIAEVSGVDNELFGFNTKEDMVGKHFLKFVPTEEKVVIRKIIKQTLVNGVAQNYELKLFRNDNTRVLTEIYSKLILGPKGVILAYMVSIKDISHRKEIAAKQYQTDRLASLGEISAGIAHEINQPLNMVYMIIDKVLFEYTKTGIMDIDLLKSKSDLIYGNIERVKKIIKHIKAFSRVHNDYMLSTFDINLSLKNALMMVSDQFKNLGIKLHKQFETNLPPVLGNTYKFEQVIINLLSNSKSAVLELKSLQDEDFEMVVDVHSFEQDHQIVIEVTDNGIGISKENIGKIMLPFYTSKDESEGTGIGLPICYKIVKEMNGTIEISSEIFVGTKVKIVFNG